MNLPGIPAVMLLVGFAVAFMSFISIIATNAGYIKTRDSERALYIGIICMIIGGVIFAFGILNGGWSTIQQLFTVFNFR